MLRLPLSPVLGFFRIAMLRLPLSLVLGFFGIAASLQAQASAPAATGPIAMPAASAAERDAVYKVVSDLFDGMRARDTASMRSKFTPNASLQSLTKDSVRFEGMEGWITGIGRAPAGLLLDERLANPVVQVNANLATVWVDYWFFAGERLSHCGVDAFKLVKLGDAWRIFSVVDTRQREGCPPAPAVKK